MSHDKWFTKDNIIAIIGIVLATILGIAAIVIPNMSIEEFCPPFIGVGESCNTSKSDKN